MDWMTTEIDPIPHSYSNTLVKSKNEFAALISMD